MSPKTILIRKLMILIPMLLLFFILVGCALGVDDTATAIDAEKKAITLTAVSFVPLDNYRTQHFSYLIEQINKKADGDFKIELLGGPEIIEPFELGIAVKNGVIDMALVPVAFYDPLVPGADIINISEITTHEERERGIYDLLNEQLYEPSGLKLLGRGTVCTPDETMYLWLNQRVESPQDLKGIKVNGGVFLNPVLGQFDMSIVSMPLGDVYTALDKGVIDAVANPFIMVESFSWFEKLGFIITHPLLSRTNTTLIMNLNKWNNIPKSMQLIIEETLIEIEPEIINMDREITQKVEEKVLQHVEKIEFEATDAQWYQEQAFYAKVEAEKEKNEELVTKLVELLTD